jgi:hypothetical protein
LVTAKTGVDGRRRGEHGDPVLGQLGLEGGDGGTTGEVTAVAYYFEPAGP